MFYISEMTTMFRETGKHYGEPVLRIVIEDDETRNTSIAELIRSIRKVAPTVYSIEFYGTDTINQLTTIQGEQAIAAIKNQFPDLRIDLTTDTTKFHPRMFSVNRGLNFNLNITVEDGWSHDFYKRANADALYQTFHQCANFTITFKIPACDDNAPWLDDGTIIKFIEMFSLNKKHVCIQTTNTAQTAELKEFCFANRLLFEHLPSL